MLKYYGITEIIGDSNVGKTAVCIEESKKYVTMYLTSTNFCIKRYEKPYTDIYIRLVQSLDDLIISISYCKYFHIELLIIDNLSSIVFLDNNSHYKICKMIYFLKNMIFKYKMKVLLVNNANPQFINSKMFFNYKLGLNYEYHVNTRYHIHKKNKDRIIEVVKSPIDLEFYYKIIIYKDHVVYTE
jgi:hypothetical protein